MRAAIGRFLLWFIREEWRAYDKRHAAPNIQIKI